MATLSINDMRQWLFREYGGADAWIVRVKKMSDSQVYAVYHRMKSVEKENSQ